MAVALLILGSVASGAAPAPAAPAAPSLCDAGTTAFSCETTAGKVLSVCASPGPQPQARWVQYRFGRPGKVELVVPPAPDPVEQGRFNLVTVLLREPKERRWELGFLNEGVQYRLYEAWREDAPDAAHRFGIRVSRDGLVLADLSCGPRRTGSFAELPLDWVIEDPPEVAP